MWLTFSKRRAIKSWHMRKLANELNLSGACRRKITKQSWNQLSGVERCSLPVDTDVRFLYKVTNESGDTSPSARPLRVLRRALCSVRFYPWTLEPIVHSILGKRFIEHAFLCNKLSHPPCPCPNFPDSTASLSLSLFLFFFFLTGSGTFILLAHLSRFWGGASHVRQKVQTGLVTTWGLR